MIDMDIRTLRQEQLVRLIQRERITNSVKVAEVEAQRDDLLRAFHMVVEGLDNKDESSLTAGLYLGADVAIQVGGVTPGHTWDDMIKGAPLVWEEDIHGSA